MVEFPSIDAKQQKTSQSDKEVMFNGEVPSEADVAKDMERQVMANNIRIMTLEEQNEKLRTSIAFLMNARDSISKKKVSERIFFTYNPLHVTFLREPPTELFGSSIFLI